MSSFCGCRRLSNRIQALGAVLLAWALLFGFPCTSMAQMPTSARAAIAMQETEPRMRREVAAAGFAIGAPIHLRIFKEEETLEVWLQDGESFRRFKTYEICAYSGDPGPKLQEGDGQSPEGFYSVEPASFNPQSAYHLSFNLGFPNAYDRAHGRTGSFLMVHGDCLSVGCFAMAKRFLPFGRDLNDPIEELWFLAHAAFSGGQDRFHVHILPFRMTDAALQRYAESPWADYWRNLREGYDIFEQTRRPPTVSLRNKRYVFNSD